MPIKSRLTSEIPMAILVATTLPMTIGISFEPRAILQHTPTSEYRLAGTAAL